VDETPTIRYFPLHGSGVDTVEFPYSASGRDPPPPALKLDCSFVADCGTDKVNAPLCKSVIDLLTILAETL
jgi:hypothetical protein